MERIEISLDIFKVQNEQILVDSRDVAEYYGILHSDLLRAIDNKLQTLQELRERNIAVSSYKVEGNRKSYKCYLLDKRGFMAISMGLTGDRAARVQLGFVDAFMKMEDQLRNRNAFAFNANIHGRESEIISGAMLLAQWAKTPDHIAIIETVKQVKAITGTNYAGLIESAKVMDDIQEDEIMLEPKELGNIFKTELARFGHKSKNAGKNFNDFLLRFNLQTKDGSSWLPNPNFKDYCFVHAWSKNNKSGYNLKWNKEFIKEFFEKAGLTMPTNSEVFPTLFS